MKDTYFITGIGTEVGKTIVSAIFTEALEADYWKPVQAGELENSDTHTVQQLISNKKSKFHPGSYNLTSPMSPHAAAEIDGITLQLKNIERPNTRNSLVIEGAGGVLVPLNEKATIVDLIQPNDKVVIVSSHYLGSINHTLLTIALLKQWQLNIFGIVFNGNENKATEEIIEKMTEVRVLGRIENEPFFDSSVISEYAQKFKDETFRKR
jgi:dethiobiotin synthetase